MAVTPNRYSKSRALGWHNSGRFGTRRDTSADRASRADSSRAHRPGGSPVAHWKASRRRSGAWWHERTGYPPIAPRIDRSAFPGASSGKASMKKRAWTVQDTSNLLIAERFSVWCPVSGVSKRIAVVEKHTLSPACPTSSSRPGESRRLDPAVLLSGIHPRTSSRSETSRSRVHEASRRVARQRRGSHRKAAWLIERADSIPEGSCRWRVQDIASRRPQADMGAFSLLSA